MRDDRCGNTARGATTAWEVRRYDLPASYSLPVHAHGHDAIAVVLAGNLALETARSDVRLGAGALCGLSHDAPHREWPDGGPVACLLVRRPGAVRMPLPDPPGGREVDPAEIPVLDAAATALSSSLPTARRAGGRVLTGVLGSRLGSDETGAGQGHPPGWLWTTWARLEREFRAPPTGAELAEAAGVSREHLVRRFRRTFRMTITSYLLQRRLEYGAELLRRDGVSISSVAHAAGFSDQSHFTRHFRSHFGTTPGRYRGSRPSGSPSARSVGPAAGSTRSRNAI